MEYFIATVVSTADHVKHKLRSDKTVNLSFDEWNIWYLDEHRESGEIKEGWPYAPRLLEDVYSVADAVVLGNLLITLLKNSDRVTSASLAQLVNVIAPIMTEPGGDVWRQTTFYPFATTSRLAQGVVLRPEIDSRPTPPRCTVRPRWSTRSPPSTRATAPERCSWSTGTPSRPARCGSTSPSLAPPASGRR